VEECGALQYVKNVIIVLSCARAMWAGHPEALPSLLASASIDPLFFSSPSPHPLVFAVSPQRLVSSSSLITLRPARRALPARHQHRASAPTPLCACLFVFDWPSFIISAFRSELRSLEKKRDELIELRRRSSSSPLLLHFT